MVFFNSLARSRYLSLISHSFSFIQWSAETAMSTILQFLFFFFFFFFFCWLILGLVFWPRFGDPCVCQSPGGVYVFLFSRTGAGLCIYHLLVWSNIIISSSNNISFSIIYPLDFFTWVLADVLRLEFDWQQVSSRTLFSILAVFNNAVVWMVTTHPPTSQSSSLFNNPLVIVPKAPSIIITFYIMDIHISVCRWFLTGVWVTASVR